MELLCTPIFRKRLGSTVSPPLQLRLVSFLVSICQVASSRKQLSVLTVIEQPTAQLFFVETPLVHYVFKKHQASLTTAHVLFCIVVLALINYLSFLTFVVFSFRIFCCC